jgi:GWxTD domain-containing protein
VVYDYLQFLKSGDEFQAEYRITFTVLSDKGNFIASERVERNLITKDFFETNAREKFDWVEENFDLAPGEYRVLLELLDKGSKEIKHNEKNVSIPRLGKSKILLSGPILLDTIIVDEEGQLDLKPGISGDVFDGRKNIWVYFEALARNFPTDLRISYHLLDSKSNERITGDFTRHIDKPVLRDKFILNISEFPFDQYSLTLTVISLGDTVKKSKNFRIRWPELPPTIHDLDEAIDQLTYIASEKEISNLKESYFGRRLEMFLKFWSQWGTNEAESYKLMDEYYQRIWEADQVFSEGGWRCDRGHVFVLYGPPSEIDRHPYDLSNKAYEVWYYFENNRRFVFVDEGGFGDYRLQSPLWQN